MFDGLFQQCLMKHLAGDRRAIAALKSQIRLVVGQLVETVTSNKPVRQPRRSPVIPRATRRGAAASPTASASR